MSVLWTIDCCVPQIDLVQRELLATELTDSFLSNVVYEFAMEAQALHTLISVDVLMDVPGFLRGRGLIVALFNKAAALFRRFNLHEHAKVLVRFHNLLHQADLTMVVDRPSKFTLLGCLTSVITSMGMSEKTPEQMELHRLTKAEEAAEIVKMKQAISFTKGAAALGKHSALVCDQTDVRSTQHLGAQAAGHGGITDLRSMISGIYADSSWPAVLPVALPVEKPAAPSASPVPAPSSKTREQREAERKTEWERSTFLGLLSFGRNRKTSGCAGCAFLRRSDGAHSHQLRSCPHLKAARLAFHEDPTGHSVPRPAQRR